MERTSSWLNEESTGNRYFERSSAGPRSRPSPRRYAHQKRPGRLLRVLLLERRIRRRYSIGKKSSCSSNFWNGGAAGKTCRNEPTPTPVLFAKAFDKTPSEALGFLVAHHRRLGPGASRPALCSTRRRQVQNGAVGDAELFGRPDEGGEAGDGKPAAAGEIEPPRPLPLNSQPPGNKRTPISMIFCVSARTCLASTVAISICRLVHSRRTVAALGIDRAVIIFGVNSAERSASDRRYWSQLRFTS